MAINLHKKMFSGAGKVYDGTLAKILMSLAQNQAVIAAATVTNLTDNGGGTADGKIEAPVEIDNHVLDNDDSVAKEALESAFDKVVDALSEVIEQLNNVREVVPAFDELNDRTGGTVADGTVSAITKSFSGTGSSLASAVGARAVYAALMGAIYQAAYFVNLAAKAVGEDEIELPAGVVPSVSTEFVAIDTGTGDAVSGADNTDDNAAVSVDDAEAMMTHLADAVKELTATLNKVTSGTPTIEVVAS